MGSLRNAHDALFSPYVPPVEKAHLLLILRRFTSHVLPVTHHFTCCQDTSELTLPFDHRGEKTAQALESNLTSLEKKIDDLLASFEESERARVEEAGSGGVKNGAVSGDSGSKENES